MFFNAPVQLFLLESLQSCNHSYVWFLQTCFGLEAGFLARTPWGAFLRDFFFFFFFALLSSHAYPRRGCFPSYLPIPQPVSQPPTCSLSLGPSWKTLLKDPFSTPCPAPDRESTVIQHAGLPNWELNELSWFLNIKSVLWAIEWDHILQTWPKVFLTLLIGI